MTYGWFGRLMVVDLSQGEGSPEEVPASAYETCLGGYGLGAKLLHERMAPGVDPLGPDSVLGFFPGLLTGMGVPFSGRFMVVGKSPLTGGWGESNCGGHFGPVLRSAGIDGLLVTGAAGEPCWIMIDDGAVRVMDASHLWGLTTAATEERIKKELGSRFQVLSIGPAGEKRSLIAAIITDRGRAAARSGLAAVMGAKRLKAIAVRGQHKVPIHDQSKLTRLSHEYTALFRQQTGTVSRVLAGLGRTFAPVLRRLRVRPSGGPADAIVHIYRDYGTCFGLAFSTEMGDSPVHNWRGVGARDFPLHRSRRISDEAVVRQQVKRYHCRHCPVGCGGLVQFEGVDGALEGSHKPEYETLAAFGSLLLNDDLETILRINSICNNAGLDTVSTGATVAFAIECVERGHISSDDLDGLSLSWGNGDAMVTLVDKIARRDGVGDLLADGVLAAARRIGCGTEAYAIHVGGQELPMHDPRYEPLLGLAYVVDPTPGRHNPANGGVVDVSSLRQVFSQDGLSLPGRYDYAGKGRLFALLNRYIQVVDCAGLCTFCLLMGRPPVREWINAATGWDLSHADLLQIGHRIQVLRHNFNLREGLRPEEWKLPKRARGSPPLDAGPLKGVSLDMDAMVMSFRRAMGYNVTDGTPTAELLTDLGLVMPIADDSISEEDIDASVS